MTLKCKTTDSYRDILDIDDRLNEIFERNNINSENIVKIISHNMEVIVIWDDGERPI